MPVPFALSVHKFIDSIGADAGFAAIVGLALLALLYFAQARESASLRSQLDEAANRIASVESRLAQTVKTQLARQPAPTPPPAPTAGTGARGGAPPRPRPELGRAGAGNAFAVAPVGLAAPALGSATKLIPTPVPAGGPADPEKTELADGHTVFVAPATAAAAAAGAVAAARANAAAGAAAGAAGPGLAGGTTAVAPAPSEPLSDPPPVTPPPAVDLPRPAAAPVRAAPARAAGATAYAGGEPGRAAGARTTLPPSGGRPGTPLTRPGAETTGRRFPAVIGAVAGLAAAAVIVILLLSAIGGSPAPAARTTAQHRTGSTTRANPAFNPAHVEVAVLNGTAINGLASRIAGRLRTAGYRTGGIGNAATQTQTQTAVEYAPGARADALQVARSLGLSRSAVGPAEATTTQMCANAPGNGTSTTSAQTSCAAQVIVTVGTDLAGAGGGSTTGAAGTTGGGAASGASGTTGAAGAAGTGATGAAG
jgi:hypothetical protein